MTIVPEPNDAGNRSALASIQWFVLSLIGTTILSLAAVHAPARIKLLGLFSIAFGLIAGFGFKRLAEMLGVKRTKLSVVVGCLLISAGLSFATYESHRIWAAKEWEAFEKSPNAQLARKSVNNEHLPEDFKAAIQESIERQHEEVKFDSYLARRISPIGNWQKPWPLAFWLMEIAVAVFAGGWVFCRRTEFKDST